MGSTARTVSGWVKLDANASGDNTLLFYGKQADGKGFWLGVDGNGYLQASGYGDTNASMAFDANGTNLRDGAWHHLAFSSDNSNNATLYIDGALAATKSAFNIDTQLNGTASYHVAISNQAGTISSNTADISVVTPPSIITHPSDTNAPTGATVTFDVNATGTVPLTYQWQKNSVNIAGATASALTLTNVQDDDNGTYRVVASNISGSVTSNGAELAVSLPATLAEFTGGLIAYYPFNGNANDESGNGTVSYTHLTLPTNREV